MDASDIDDDDDDTSSTSSVDSHDPDEEFEVEAILAEYIAGEDGSGENRYLVQWAGFPMHQCTWEPEANLGDDLRAMWNEEKQQLPPGQQERNQIAFQEALDQAEADRMERGRRRKATQDKTGSASLTSTPTKSREALLSLLFDEDSNEANGADPSERPAPEPPVMRPVASQQMFKSVSNREVDSGTRKGRQADSDTAKTRVLQTPLTASVPTIPRINSTSTDSQPVRRKSATGKSTKGTGLPVPSRESPLRRRSSVSSAPRNLNSKLKAKKSNHTGSNIFIAGEEKKRGGASRSQNTSAKEPKLFQKHRHVWRASKRSRDMENLAPTPSRASLYDISTGLPPKQSVEDNTGRHPAALRSVAELDLSVQRPPTSLSNEQLEKPIAKRKSVRFLPEEQHDLTTEPMDIDNLRPTTRESAEESLFVPQNNLEAGDSGTASIETPLSSVSVRKTSSFRERRPRPSPTRCVEKNLQLGGSEILRVVFDGIPDDSQQAWVASFASQEVLEINRTFFVKSKAQFQSLIQATLCGGVIRPEKDPDALIRSAEYLRMTLLGLFYEQPEFKMIIFPDRCDDWIDLFGQEPSSPSGQISLRFRIFSSALDCGRVLPSLDQLVDEASIGPKATEHNRVAIMAKFLGLDYTRLLPVFPGLETHNFFVAFPHSQAFLLLTLCRWLRTCNPACRIYTAERPGSWSAFRSCVTHEPGVVIVHEQLAQSLSLFPNLDRYLTNNRDTYWCFSGPRYPRPVFPSITTPGTTVPPGTVQLTRLFPHRAAILLTPSFLVSEPQRAVEFLMWWLENWAKRSDYRLITAHNFHEYLADLELERSRARKDFIGVEKETPRMQARLDEAGLGDESSYLRRAAVELANEIHSIHLTKTELFGESDDYTSLTFVDACIDPNDEQSLVNWFGWWSSLRLDQFRKFYVMGSSPDIGIEGPRRAEREIRIPKYTRATTNDIDAVFQALQQKVDLWNQDPAIGSEGGRATVPNTAHTSSHRPSNSFHFFTDVLYGLSRVSTGTRLAFLYAFPVSYADFDMADRFGGSLHHRCKRIAEWFDYTRAFVDVHGSSQKWTKPYLGLFYTIKENWASVKTLDVLPQSWHPWLAVYRPIQSYKRPIKGVELLIWDVSAKGRFRDGGPPKEEELIDMQRRLIDHLRQHGAKKNPGTLLENVWLGGFDIQESESAQPLDVTMSFLKEAMENTQDLLPNSADDLLRKGFKRVKLKTDLEETARPYSPSILDRRMDLVDLDDDDELSQEDDDMARIIFHPRPGTNQDLRKQSKCSNRLFEQQRLSRLQSPSKTFMTYRFTPTEDWYSDYRAEGCAYEHINVGSWASIFQHLRIGPKGVSSRPSSSKSSAGPPFRGEESAPKTT